MPPATVDGENPTVAVFELAYTWAHLDVVSVFLGFLIICIICGNALVVLAVLTERHLRVGPHFICIIYTYPVLTLRQKLLNIIFF